MSTEMILNAAVRNETGTGPAGRLRRQGLVPAVFYGRGQTPKYLTINYKELRTVLLAASGSRSLFQLRIAGEEPSRAVMLKEKQIDPVKRTLIHVDLVEVDITKPQQVEVPVVFTGKAEGVERGGQLQQLRRTVMVSALPQYLPDQIEVDVTDLNMGHSIHVADITPPADVHLVFEDNFALVSVISPKGAKAEAVEGEGEDEG